MKTNAALTIYHEQYDKETRMAAYRVFRIDCVWVQANLGAKIVDGGLKAAHVVKVRIPAGQVGDGFSENCVKTGDRAVLYDCSDPVPPEDAYTVLGIADNRKGSHGVWHYKLELA